MSMSLRLFILKPDGLSDHALVIYIVENLKYIAGQLCIRTLTHLPLHMLLNYNKSFLQEIE